MEICQLAVAMMFFDNYLSIFSTVIVKKLNRACTVAPGYGGVFGQTCDADHEHAFAPGGHAAAPLRVQARSQLVYDDHEQLGEYRQGVPRAELAAVTY